MAMTEITVMLTQLLASSSCTVVDQRVLELWEWLHQIGRYALLPGLVTPLTRPLNERDVAA